MHRYVPPSPFRSRIIAARRLSMYGWGSAIICCSYATKNRRVLVACDGVENSRLFILWFSIRELVISVLGFARVCGMCLNFFRRFLAVYEATNGILEYQVLRNGFSSNMKFRSYENLFSRVKLFNSLANLSEIWILMFVLLEQVF